LYTFEQAFTKEIILELQQWTNGGTTKRMGTSVQLLSETIFKEREKMLQKALIYIVSPIFFHLSLGENRIGERSAA
jgi:hypothetical protein